MRTIVLCHAATTLAPWARVAATVKGVRSMVATRLAATVGHVGDDGVRAKVAEGGGVN